MSEELRKTQLVQVTSLDVLLNNGLRVTWQGFRPAEGGGDRPTIYYTTIPGDGNRVTVLSMAELGAQASATPVEVTLLNGVAQLDGTPLEIDRPVILPGIGGGEGAQLEFTSMTCTLKVCPKSSGGAVAGAAMARSAEDGPGGDSPPPPYPGQNR